MRPQIETSDGILGGRQVTYDFRLEKDGIQGNYAFDGLGFKRASIQVFCGAGTEAAGSAPILQRNTSGGVGFPLLVPETIDFTEGETTGVFDIEFSGRYLFLDMSGLVFSEEGQVQIIFVGKN